MPAETTASAPATAASAPWFNRVTFFGFLAGLCPLIPIPFLDDRVLLWVRRRMVREVLAGAGLSREEAQVRLLAGESGKGFLYGCAGSLFLLPLIKITVYLVRKVVRKILLILTLKECSDRFSETLHEGYLLHRAAAGGWLAPAAETAPGESARRVRAAMAQAFAAVDPRPVHQLIKQAFRGSRFLLIRAARVLARGYRRLRPGTGEGEAAAVLAAEADLLGSLQQGLNASLWTQQAYWARLDEHFRQAWAAGEAAEPSSTDRS
jgi:hypothetical protein